ncbi:MAG: hypothetical protein ACJA0X_000945 [Cyclobacteriaceae bacterium]
MQKKILVVSFLIIMFNQVSAQILDDTTELVYGSKTTKIIFERDIKYNQETLRHPDTTLYKIESFEVLDDKEHYYQDLGNNGTAMWSVFYEVDDRIGRSSGFNSFRNYVRNYQNMAFYDTKSPFIDIEVVFGGQGRSSVDLSFSRNVNANWNVGFDIHRITSDKQTGTLREGDRNIIGSVYDMYSFYKHPELPYKLILSVSQLGFDVAETGGIQVDENPTNEDLYLYQDSDNQLTNATAEEKRADWHIYQEYVWTKPLQFYHQLDYMAQSSRYEDFDDGASGADYDSYGDFYDSFYLDQDSTYSLSKWSELNNEFGIKGQLDALFYSAYVKHKYVDQNFLYNDPTRPQNEFYIGGYTRFDWKDKFNVSGKVEFLQTGEYYLKGDIQSELIFGSYISKRQIPGYIYQSYFSNHRFWDNDFKSSFSNEIKGGLKVKYKSITLVPQLRILSQNQFLYFDQLGNAAQSNGLGLLTSIGGNANVKLTTNKELNEAFHFENEVYFSALSGAESDKMRVPNVFYNGRFFWRGLWFKKSMEVEIGLDIQARSGYKGLAYIPDIQQFGLQEDFTMESFVATDFFINMKVNNFRAFVKVTHANQQAASGYFVTPYYPGLPRVVDFGFKWMFFD